mmetsp:Transcript_27182/g.33812  ORF Transcript_27182/g.33812 Transcript_27182/m.33812 type:complete len:303 (+) Transcript_27182:888-1796(+)
MVPDVLDCVALGGIWVQNVANEVLGVLRQKARHFVICLDDLLIQLLRILILKGQVAANHRVQDDTRTPDVCTEAEVTLTADHLRGGIAGTTARCFELLAFLVEVAEAEIDELNVVVVVEEEVLGLEVAMDDAQLVNILNARQNLRVHLAGFGLLEAPVLDNVLEKLSTRAVLHYQVQVVIVLNHLQPATKAHAIPVEGQLNQSINQSQAMEKGALTSYNWTTLGCLTRFKIVISRLIRSKSAASLIFSFSRIFIATFSLVGSCVPCLTLPNVPLPFVLPTEKLPIFLYFSLAGAASAAAEAP